MQDKQGFFVGIGWWLGVIWVYYGVGGIYFILEVCFDSFLEWERDEWCLQQHLPLLHCLEDDLRGSSKRLSCINWWKTLDILLRIGCVISI